MNARARNFLTANRESPVVYGSVDGRCVTYRLANGTMFYLNADEAMDAGMPRWAFEERKRRRYLAAHERENAALLAKVEREAGRR